MKQNILTETLSKSLNRGAQGFDLKSASLSKTFKILQTRTLSMESKDNLNIWLLKTFSLFNEFTIHGMWSVIV